MTKSKTYGILVRFQEPNGEQFTSFYGADYLEEMKKDKAVYKYVVDEELELLSPVGKTYAERKADVLNTAILYSYFNQAGLSYAELFDIQDYFERFGRRYGLLKEFHENGIC